MSFGACEAEQTTQYLAFENSVFTQAAAQGISVFASSGDSGAAGCETAGATPPSTQVASISDICSSAAVTCVGGTQFSDTASPASYWSSTSNTSNARSALGYIPEGAWNEPSYTTSSNTTAYAPSATGGGVSAYTAKPLFQAGAGVPADGARDVPDISFSASTHNGYFICLAYLKADCTQYLTAFGGTSASAPSMAGVAALLDQKLSARQGNLNPLLYKLAAGAAAAFHDAVPATSGVASCSTATASTCNNSTPSATGLAGGLAGFPLTTGYDLSTGLGSLDVAAFLAAATPSTLAATSTSLSPISSAVPSTVPVTFTATVTSAATVTPTGTVQFSVDGQPAGAPVSLSSGAATTSLYFVPGLHSVTASYSGSAGFTASTSAPASVTSTITPTGVATSFPGTVYRNGSATLTAVVTAASGYTSPLAVPISGTVLFKDMTSGNTLGLATVLSRGASGATATLSTTFSTLGSHTISVTYSGDTNYSSSTFAGGQLFVSPPAAITLAPASPSLTVLVGASTTDVVTATSTSFSGTEALTCAVTFTGAGAVTSAPTCSFSPASLTFTGSGSMTSTLTVTTATSSPNNGPLGRNCAPSLKDHLTTLGGASLAALLLLVLPRRGPRTLRAVRLLSTVIFLAIALTALSGCGSLSYISRQVSIPGTTKGSYNITLNADSALNQPNNVGSSVAVTLTVQ